MWAFISSAVTAGALWVGGKLGIHAYSYALPAITGTQAALAFASMYICSGGYHTLWLMYMTGPRDIRALTRLLRVKLLQRQIRKKNLTVPRYFQTIVKRHPKKVALIFEGQEWTFQDLDEYSNKVGNFLVENGFQRGDVIAIYMENRPEFVAMWLGCAKAGVVAALINFNLKHQPLLHSITVSNAKSVICGGELLAGLEDIQDQLGNISVWVTGLKENTKKSNDWTDMDLHFETTSNEVPLSIEGGHYTDDLMYIYTSGTTGLPKAAIIKHARYFFFASGVHYLLQLKNNDVIYNPLPLYHTAGGIVGIGQVILFGLTAVIRKKFSVTNFWPEAKRHGCTVGQYVGEICRYLLNTPSKPEETDHSLRLMFGNGVRAQIWEEFTSRFNMPHIAEFYGSTEGNANIVNYEGKPKACGFVPILTPWAYPVRLIKVDEKTGEAVRDNNGFCIFCKPGEPGEFVGKIRRGDAVGDFHGYADKKATEKKVVRNVFSKGDYAFSSGDVLEMDELGYVYFKDRLGDTFRWRGENVSATEVEGVISQVANHKDAVVFGVEIPGAEGKAGMAAIVDPNEELDLEAFNQALGKFLPTYARPIIVRILSQIDTTGTFKLKKLTLKKEGYNVNNIDDKIYFMDAKQRKYVPLTQELYERIINGKSGL